MDDLLHRLALCVEKGKINKAAPYPPELAGQDGADELARLALDQGISPYDILHKACIPGMFAIGEKFKKNEVYVPQLLIAAKAMAGVMIHLKPFFKTGEIRTKGTFIIGTVSGDLHDIGKNLVSMIVEGAGYTVIDLGIDIASSKFLSAIGLVAAEKKTCAVGLSALLTTTMANMGKTVAEIRAAYPDVKILVGGAPLTEAFARSIHADFYSPDPQGAVEYLNEIME